MMSEATGIPTADHPERRGAERQISVLINAGIHHDGQDALCRIRNLSSGGVMIECGLPLKVDDRVQLQLRSGRRVDGCVRWLGDARAGIAFDDEDAAAVVTERLASSSLVNSAIGFPLFERDAWAELLADHVRLRTPVLRISPTGIVVSDNERWADERVFTVKVDGLGDHLARRADAAHGTAGDELSLVFVQPLHFRALNDWLASMPPPIAALGNPAQAMDARWR